MGSMFYRVVVRSGLRSITFFGVLAALMLSSHCFVMGADGFEGTTTFHRQALSGLKSGKGFTVEAVPVQNETVTLLFEPTEIKAKRYRAEVVREGGTVEPLDQLPINLFTGKVIREDSSSSEKDFAKLSFSHPGNLVEGLMRVDGVLYDLSSMAQKQNIVLTIKEIPLDDLKGLFLGCGASLWEELAPLMESAATDDTTDPSSSTQASEAATTLQEVELGTEATASFVAIFGSESAANNKIISIINAQNGIYETDLGLTNKIVIQRAFSSTDPYSESDSSTLLSQFRSEWEASVPKIYDVAQLFSGVNTFESSVVGRAWLSAVCTTFGYGVNAYYNQSDSLLKVVVSHEEGHNFGANHSSTGIMSPTVSSSLTNFAPESITEIENFVNSINCLSDVVSGNPPTLDPIGPQTVTEGITLQLTLSGSDPDGDPVTYSATPLPVGATMNQEGTFTYLPPFDTVGCSSSTSKSVLFSIVDSNGNSDSELVTITVHDNPGNNPPVLNNPGNKTVQEGQSLNFTLEASDVDGDTITFGSPDLPVGASLSQTTGQFQWTPSQGQSGSHSVTFTATDCVTNFTVSETITITVEEIVLPHLTSLSPTEGPKSTVVTISGTNLLGSNTIVYFGSKVASIISSSDNGVSVHAPRQNKKTAATVLVKIVRDGAESNTLPYTYTKSQKPGGGGGRGGKGKNK